MGIKELEARIKNLEDQLGIVQDIEEIKKLQRIYGYYLEHWMAEDVIDLFSDSPDVCVIVRAGVFKGKESVKRFFRHGKDAELKITKDPEFMHQVMQLQGVVSVDPDGKKAKGRWYGFGANAFPQKGGKVNSGWMNGVYENEYIKENGKWKILILHWCMTFHASYKTGWVELSKQVEVDTMSKPDFSSLKADAPSENTLYPSGYQCPLHFKNPVTGK
jgi:hypothetical protein